MHKVEEPIPDSLSFSQLSMVCIETCLRDVWHLKIKSVIGPMSVIAASTLFFSIRILLKMEIRPIKYFVILIIITSVSS
jgi:hypothetical protein